MFHAMQQTTKVQYGSPNCSFIVHDCARYRQMGREEDGRGGECNDRYYDDDEMVIIGGKLFGDDLMEQTRMSLEGHGTPHT